MGNLEKPKRNRLNGQSSSSEHAKLKAFCERNSTHVLGLLLAMLDDANQRLRYYRQADYLRDVATLRRRYANEGLSFATKTLPSLFSEFLLYLETGQPSYTSFKTVRSRKHPVFLRRLFSTVVECRDDASCIESMQCLYQLCHAFKKLRGPYKPSTLQKQLWSFVETDIDLRYIDFFSEPIYPILLRARQLVKRLFADMDPEFDTDLFVPRPGPGATNEPRRKDVRYRPHVLYKQLDDVFPYVEYFYSHPWDVVTGSLAYKALEGADAPSSRFKFVPKTFGKPRGICIEELETQYLQQAVKRAMYYRLQTDPLTKGLINFDDQSVNGAMAVEASLTRQFATIDMSEASDRVSRTLVRYLFHDCPDMCDALMALSTRTIELPDDLIDFPNKLPCEKFAPMGSAVCFPVMALVHFVLIKAILSLADVPHEDAQRIYVYGDDIILPTTCVQAVYDYLPLFGMKLNTEKSYAMSSFRESCGRHAYKGVEITPTYFKYTPESHSPRDALISLFANEALLFQRGFFATAAYLRSAMCKVRSLRGYDIPFVSPKSPVLGWIRDTDDAPRIRWIGLKRRHKAELHSWEVRAIVAVSKQLDLTIACENEAYLRRLCDWGSYPSSTGRADARDLPTSPPAGEAAYTLVESSDGVLVDTLKGAQWLKDSSLEPPRFVWKWVPESVL